MLLLCLLAPVVAAAHGPEATGPYLPSPTPDRIILTYSGDPATTQSVTWRTDSAASAPQVEFAPTTATGSFGGRQGFAIAAVATYATTQWLDTELGRAAYHTAEMVRLEPQTLYAYRVGDGAVWSEWFHFHTASREAEPFTFVYVGDAQNDLKSLWSRTIRQAYGQAQPQLLVHAGDLVNRAHHDAEWGE